MQRAGLRLGAAGLVVASVTAAAVTLPSTVAGAVPGTAFFAASVAQGTGDCSSQANACTLTTALADLVPGGILVLVTPGSSAHYVGNFTLSAGSDAMPVTIEPAAGVSDPILDGNNGSATGCPTTVHGTGTVKVTGARQRSRPSAPTWPCSGRRRPRRTRSPRRHRLP